MCYNICAVQKSAVNAILIPHLMIYLWGEVNGVSKGLLLISQAFVGVDTAAS